MTLEGIYLDQILANHIKLCSELDSVDKTDHGCLFRPLSLGASRKQSKALQVK